MSNTNSWVSGGNLHIHTCNWKDEGHPNETEADFWVRVARENSDLMSQYPPD